LCDLLSDLPPKVSERITYHGARSHTQILEFYRSATVFVFPSVWDEPFGMPIVEAMACGLPVVATRGGGIPEIVHDGKTGIPVSKGNATELHFAIARLLDDPDLCASLGEAGCRRAKEVFSWNIVAENLSSCFDSVSAQPMKPTGGQIFRP
jgi:glycosyltransferase involved in cell wall biosynthesis